MKNRFFLFYTLVTLLLALFGSFLWFMYTAVGTSILVKGITRVFSNTIEIGTVTGRVGRSLHIEGLRINTQETNITVSTVDLKWQPLYLLTGRLSITELGIRDVVVTNKKPSEDTPYDLLLPNVPVWFNMIQGQSDNLNISGLRYVTPRKEPVTVDSMSTKILWYKGALYVTEMKAKTSYGTAKGDLMVSLARPAIRARLKIDIQKTLAGIDNISIDTRLPASKGEVQIAGPVILKAAAGTRERFNMECLVAVTRHTIRMSSGKLSEKGRRGNIEASGVLDVSGPKPEFTLSSKINRLDVGPEATVNTDLSGNLDVAGTLERYDGRFNLKNVGSTWKNLELGGNIHGDTERVEFANLGGKLLGGTLFGGFKATWTQDVILSAHLTGKNLDPARIRPGLQGNVNVEFRGRLQIPDNLPMEGSFTAVVLNSHFQKRAVSGKLDAALHKETLKINTLTAKGNGFTINAAGTIPQRVSYEVQIDDASKVLPGTKGSLFARGWARWRDNEAAGIINMRGQNIAYNSTKVSSFRGMIQMPEGYKGKIAVDTTARNISYGSVQADLATLRINGRTDGHEISLTVRDNNNRIDLLADGKYADGVWMGTILKASGKDAFFGRYELETPSTVNISGKQVRGSFALIGEGGERIDVNADIVRDPVIGSIDVHWQNVNLARADRFIGRSKFEGRTSGVFRGQWSGKHDLALSGRISASGTFSRGPIKLKVAGINGKLVWNKLGLLASCDVNLDGGGQVNATMGSKEPAALALPERGTFQTAWKSIDMDLLRPVFPHTLKLNGEITGEMKGDLLPGGRLDLSGETGLSGGTLSWRNDHGEITTVMKEADLQWTWKDTYLNGHINLALAQHGLLEASFRIPLSAHIPSKINRNSPIIVTAKGELREKGMLSSLFPGLVQETSGHIDFRLTGGGTFTDPQLDGELNLSDAGAYLPSAGISLKDASARILFKKDEVTIASFYVRSGSGFIGGGGTTRLKNRQVDLFQGTLKGERFQAINLPELQAVISPEVTFSGSAKNVSAKGSVLISEALLSQEQKDTLIKTSSDVVIKGKQAKQQRTPPFLVNAVVSVIFGDHVMVKAHGVDTGLTGKVDVTMRDLSDISARGVISTVNGKYDGYGVKLDITRGQVVFSGDSLDRAALDILATRKVDDVTAGVKVTGTISSPLVDLYSMPAMPDMDVLSYIVLGRPEYNGQNDMALLTRAAAGLLTSGKSSGLQDRLKNRLGLDTIGIESGNGDFSQSIIKIGKYLSPKLYISYGRSIFTGENLFGLKYNLSKRIDLESTTGNKNSAVLYYKIEFD